MTAPHVLVVLDFAGTLSFDTVGFGQPDRLMTALRESGLAALGVDEPATFWSQIVEPTWQRGSTTETGYATVVAEAVTELRRSHGQPIEAAAIRTAADAFTARYLDHSTIAEAWWPWLRRLAARPDTTVAVATEHYAEMTDHLVRMLVAGGLAAATLHAGERRLAPGHVAIATSADLGCHKTDAAFWEQLRRALPAAPSAVLVVDDFGANENPDSAYADHAAVRRRRDRIVAALTEAFRVTPSMHHLTVAADDDPSGAIVCAGQWLETTLEAV